MPQIADYRLSRTIGAAPVEKSDAALGKAHGYLLGPSFRGTRSVSYDVQCTSENLEIPGLVLTHHPGMTILNDGGFYAARILERKASISERRTSVSRRSAPVAFSTSPAADPASAEAVETPMILLETSEVPPAAC
jgi:hypothetical protein